MGSSKPPTAATASPLIRRGYPLCTNASSRCLPSASERFLRSRSSYSLRRAKSSASALLPESMACSSFPSSALDWVLVVRYHSMRSSLHRQSWLRTGSQGCRSSWCCCWPNRIAMGHPARMRDACASSLVTVVAVLVAVAGGGSHRPDQVLGDATGRTAVAAGRQRVQDECKYIVGRCADPARQWVADPSTA